MSTDSKAYLVQLRYLLEQYCRPSEIKHLCAQLSVDYDSLPNGTVFLKLNGLIRHCAQHGRLEELVGRLRQLKPAVPWPDVPSAEQQVLDQQILTTGSDDEEAFLQRFLDELRALLRVEQGDDPQAGQQLGGYLSRLVVETLGHLDPQRKAELVRLLYEANLIIGRSPVIRLDDADLSRIDLGWQHLPEINLSGANLMGADLSLCNLRGAFLAGADLRQSILKALLAEADLTSADLREAQLSRSKMIGAHLTGANLQMADLGGADLAQADLSEAILAGANLSMARLDNANLTACDLRGSTLDQVNLSGTAVDQQQLQSASSMKGAILSPTKSHALS